MTELFIICAIGVLGVAFAFAVARWLLQLPTGDAELVRVASLVTSGVNRYLRRQHVVAIGFAAVLGAGLFLVFGVAYQTGSVGAVSARAYGLWAAASYCCGAALAVAAAYVSAWSAGKAGCRVAAGALRSLGESLQIAIRGGAVSGVMAVALALLGLALLFGAHSLIDGPVMLAPGSVLMKTSRIPLLLGGFALGAAVVALLAQIGGGTFGSVADIGLGFGGKLSGGQGFSSGPGLPATANPAVLADLVGDNVGDGAARAVSIYAATVVESLAAMLVAAQVYRDSADLPSVTAIVLFPLVTRAFGLLASWFGVLVVRTDDTEVPMNALARGFFVTTLLHGVAAMGAAKWLVGAHWLALGACVVLGGAASVVLVLVVQYYSEQRYRPVRSLADAARGGGPLATLRGLSTAAEASLVLLLVFVATVLAAYHVGATTSLTGGGRFGLALAIGGMLGVAPYVLAMDALGSIADTAGGLIELTVAAERPDVRARGQLLDSVGTTSKSFTRVLSALSSSVGCFLLLSTFIEEVGRAARGTAVASSSFNINSPLAYCGGVLGLVIVLAFVRAMLWRIVGTSRDYLHELRAIHAETDDLADKAGAESTGLSASESSTGGDDLGSRPSEEVAAVLADAEAGWEAREQRQEACVEIVSRMALRSMLPPLLVGLGLPLFIGVALRIWATGDTVVASAEAIVALLFVATIAGALGTLLFTTAGSAWDNAKKYIETGAHGGRHVLDHTAKVTAAAAGPAVADNPTYAAAAGGDTVGDPLKKAVGPATQSLVTVLVTLALVLLPFFL